MKLRHLILASAVSLSLPLAAFADSGKDLIQKGAKKGVKITKSFSSVGNLKGYVVESVKNPSQKTIVYADKDGKYMIAGGTIIGADGSNVTQQDHTKYIDNAMAPKVLAAAQKTHWFEQGNPKAPHHAYVLVEPNCIACHMLHKELMPLIKSGKLSVRWIMVSFLKPDSQGKAAAILQAKNPAKAFTTDEASFDVNKEEGSIQPVKNVTDKTKKALKDNLDFMQKYGFIGTPVIIYQTKDGKPKVMKGFLPGKAMRQAVSEMGQF